MERVLSVTSSLSTLVDIVMSCQNRAKQSGLLRGGNFTKSPGRQGAFGFIGYVTIAVPFRKWYVTVSKNKYSPQSWRSGRKRRRTYVNTWRSILVSFDLRRTCSPEFNICFFDPQTLLFPQALDNQYLA